MLFRKLGHLFQYRKVLKEVMQLVLMFNELSSFVINHTFK